MQTATSRIVQAAWAPDGATVGGMVLRTVPGQPPRAVLARQIRRPAARRLDLSDVLAGIASALA